MKDSKSQIRVLVVDDSQVAQALLTHILESDQSIKVIGYASSGVQALELLNTIKPDIITMDVVMPQMDGFEATRKILQTHPIPIIIISASYKKENVEKAFLAIEAGALAILEKPKGPLDPTYESSKKNIIETVKLMSEIKVVAKRFPIAANTKPSLKGKLTDTNQETRKIEAVAIGASLGGPQALQAILSRLPKSFPVPILIVQHISEGFLEGFADWLQSITELTVKIPANNEEALPGTVYVAPEKMHMQISKNSKITLINEPPIQGIRPAISRLFHSMAETFGPNGLGLLLTGMGKDGAEELLTMRQHGAITIAQNKESCILYGMPEEAIRLGAAQYVLSLEEIPKALIQILGHSKMRLKK